MDLAVFLEVGTCLHDQNPPVPEPETKQQGLGVLFGPIAPRTAPGLFVFILFSFFSFFSVFYWPLFCCRNQSTSASERAAWSFGHFPVSLLYCLARPCASWGGRFVISGITENTHGRRIWEWE